MTVESGECILAFEYMSCVLLWNEDKMRKDRVLFL